MYHFKSFPGSSESPLQGGRGLKGELEGRETRDIVGRGWEGFEGEWGSTTTHYFRLKSCSVQPQMNGIRTEQRPTYVNPEMDIINHSCRSHFWLISLADTVQWLWAKGRGSCGVGLPLTPWAYSGRRTPVGASLPQRRRLDAKTRPVKVAGTWQGRLKVSPLFCCPFAYKRAVRGRCRGRDDISRWLERCLRRCSRTTIGGSRSACAASPWWRTCPTSRSRSAGMSTTPSSRTATSPRRETTTCRWRIPSVTTSSADGSERSSITTRKTRKY